MPVRAHKNILQARINCKEFPRPQNTPNSENALFSPQNPVVSLIDLVSEKDDNLIMAKIHVVLLEPEIPQNTGNIARTCAATGSSLHLIKPLGFSLEDKYMKRAGLDYWSLLDLHVYENLADFYEKNPNAEVYYFSKKACHVYSDVSYPDEVYLMFGKETKGIPEPELLAHYQRTLRMPMREGLRSLNLSNAVAIAVYEVLRQKDFADLALEGKFKDLP